jgi:hypothetical protein
MTLNWFWGLLGFLGILGFILEESCAMHFFILSIFHRANTSAVSEFSS